MTRLEVLMMVYTLKKLLDRDLVEDAKDILNKVIEEAELNKVKKDESEL